jgi:hypothetical protein
MSEGDLTGTVGATIQMAWKHRRDHHVIVSRRNHDPILLCHLEAHELTHLRMETEARKIGGTAFSRPIPPTTRKRWGRWPRSAALQPQRLLGGVSDPLFHNLIGGLCSFVYNCPLDMLIERHLREDFPPLRPPSSSP